MAVDLQNEVAGTLPLITTIIPTFRRPQLLRRAIQSVLNQTFPDFQVCVYDNASGDESVEIVAEFMKKDSRVKYYCHPKNIGAIANFNYGMSRVETPFFSFLSDDDILLPHFYETALKGFKKYPGAVFSAGSVISMTDKGEIIGSQLSTWPREGSYSPPEGLIEMLGMKHPTWTGVLFRNKIIKDVGLLDREVGSLSDMDFELRVAAHFPFVISQQPCAIFVQHALSACSLIDLDFFWPGWLKVVRNIKENEHISADVSAYIEQRLIDQLKTNLFTTDFILKKNFHDGYKASDILQNRYGQKTRAAILYLITRLCESFPPAYSLLVGRMKIRAMLRRVRSRDLQKQFGHYARLLDLDGASLNE